MSNIEDYKNLLDSRLTDPAEIRANKEQLMVARFESSNKMSLEEKMIVKLYQLKLKMDEESNAKSLKVPFYSYSSDYVDLLYSTRKAFARDIDFSETQLSLILSGRRPATEEFVLKIKIHSCAVFQKLKIKFDARNWFTIYHLDRMNEFLSTHKNMKVSHRNINKSMQSLGGI